MIRLLPFLLLASCASRPEPLDFQPLFDKGDASEAQQIKDYHLMMTDPAFQIFWQ